LAIVSGAIFIHFGLFALGSFLLNYVHQHAIYLVNLFVQHLGGIWMISCHDANDDADADDDRLNKM
jgi:hypothetical protein